MKVRIELLPQDAADSENEVVIRCRSITTDVLRIKACAESGTDSPPSDILLTLNGEEYIMPLADILFFESYGDRVAAHTADAMFYTERTLSQLEGILGGHFFRTSKSCIVGLDKISSLRREFTGVCEVRFFGSVKSAYVSRMYYKAFRERLEQIRLGQ